MKNIWIKRFSALLVLALSFVFIIRFAGPKLLTNYVESGIGNCQTIPILCKVPEKDVTTFQPDKAYIQDCIPYKFPKVEICIPKGFKVVQELIKRPYYKKRKPHNGEPVVYLIHQGPGYFCKLFPQLTKLGINDNYKFLMSMMFSRVSQINNLNDAFFVIMKSIFTPDLGDQNLVKMIQFEMEDKAGFINYTISPKFNYFDCSIVNKEGDFFKVYIRDSECALDLKKVISIISTVSGGKQSA